MLKLEQLAALVVAAGLALVSYWLFFSWAGGGGYEKRDRPGAVPTPTGSEAASGLHHPLIGVAVIEAAEVGLDVLGRHRQAEALANGADALHRT